MLTVDPMAYARSRQTESMRAANAARMAGLARSTPRPASPSRWPGSRWLSSRLQLKPAAPMACCC
jgi:hypothetical protein